MSLPGALPRQGEDQKSNYSRPRQLDLSQEKWIKAFTEIPESVKAAGIEFPKEVIEALLGGNAAKLLKLGQ
jgi:hypothetical protein